jgi:hypothetical protein
VGAIPEIASIASTFQTAVEWAATAAPEPLQPAVQIIGGDLASVVALSPTLPAVGRLGVSGWPQLPPYRTQSSVSWRVMQLCGLPRPRRSRLS